MSAEHKKLWDEALNEISEKYTSEAAELMSRTAGVKQEDMPEAEEPSMEIRTEPSRKGRRNILTGVCTGAAAAAVIACVVGITLTQRGGEITSDPDSAVTSGSETSGSTTDAYDITADNTPIIYDEDQYTLDFELFERYFHGKWDNPYTTNMYSRVYGGTYYVGYSPTNKSIATDLFYMSDMAAVNKVGFLKTDDGCYMGVFGEGETSVFFVSDKDRDHIYVYVSGIDEKRSDSSGYRLERVGDIEDKGGALNYMGTMKLCEELGIDPGLISGIDSVIVGDMVYTARNSGSPLGVLGGLIVRERTDDKLTFSLPVSLLSTVSSLPPDNRYVLFSMTKNADGTWNAPVRAEEEYDAASYRWPESGTVNDADAELEGVLYGEWRDNKNNSVLPFGYTDFTDTADPDGWNSFKVYGAWEDETGWSFNISGTERYPDVMFIPKAQPDMMYVCTADDSGNASVLRTFRRTEAACQEQLEFSGSLSSLGEERFYEYMGEQFKTAAYDDCLAEYYDGKRIRVDAETGDFDMDYSGGHLIVDSLGETEVKLALPFERTHLTGQTDGTAEYIQCYVFTFESDGDGWKNTGMDLDIDYDYTTLDVRTDNDFSVFEDHFMGKWERLTPGSENPEKTISYSGGLYSSVNAQAWFREAYRGTDGWYIGGLSGGAGEIYYIPFYSDGSTDGEIRMYYYSDVGAGDVKKNEYGDCWRFVEELPETEKELHPNMTLSDIGKRKLGETVGSDFLDVLNAALGTPFFDSEGNEWYSPFFSDPDLTLLYFDKDSVTVSYELSDVHTSSDDYDDYPLSTFIFDFVKGEDGVWSYTVTSADGEVYDDSNSLDYSMDMNIYESAFIGEWQDSDGNSFTLSYTEDFFENSDWVSWASGFASNIYGSYMTGHRVSAGYDNEFIPFMDTVYYIPADEPDTMYVYEDGRMKGMKPTAVYTRTGEASAALPEHGLLSDLAIYKLAQEAGGDFHNALEKYRISGEITDESGKLWRSTLSRAVKSRDLYLMKNDPYKVTLLMPFFDGDSFNEINDPTPDAEMRRYIVTFEPVGEDEHWQVTATEPERDLSGVNKIPTSDGGWYSVEVNAAENGLTHVYYYSAADDMVYELADDIYGGIYAVNGDDLFVMGTYEDDYANYMVISRFVNGTADSRTFLPMLHDLGGAMDGSFVWEYSPSFLEFSGGYLLAGWNESELNGSAVIDPYWARTLNLIIPPSDIESLEVNDGGFTVRGKDGSETFCDTDTLDGTLPLLDSRLLNLWCMFAIDSSDFGGSGNENTAIITGTTKVYQAGRPLFPTFAALRGYMGRAMTDELADATLEQYSDRVLERNGLIYATCGARGSNLYIADVKIGDVEMIDDTHAEVTYNVYSYVDDDLEKVGEEPSETYTAGLEKTEDGWRFTDFYYPY